MDREGGTVFVDLTQVLVSEWEAALGALDAALTGILTTQVVLYSGVLAVGSAQAGLMESLTNAVQAEGVRVRAVYYPPEGP